jgi:hypothetical protein
MNKQSNIIVFENELTIHLNEVMQYLQGCVRL